MSGNFGVALIVHVGAVSLSFQSDFSPIE